jgi:hypothetical protein
MSIRNFIPSWPIVRQLRTEDQLGLAKAVPAAVEPEATHGRDGPRGEVHLPLLRSGLRAEGISQER